MENELSYLTTKIFKAELNEDSKQVTTDCKLKLIANENFIEHDKYLKLLSCSGFTKLYFSFRVLPFRYSVC